MSSKTNERQNIILKHLCKGTSLSISEISNLIKDISKITFNRDLSSLLEFGFIKKIGKGRSTKYSLSEKYNLIKEINSNEYFQKEVDQRITNRNFQWDILENMKNFISDKTLDLLEANNKKYLKRIQRTSKTILQKEYERLTIELSWKSSHIEGNTYSLLETEDLIKNHQEAKGHSKEEANMILNHKEAFEIIRKNKSDFKKLNVMNIENIHAILTRNLKVSKGIRKTGVGIIGTNYKPIDNQHQIREALELACQTINKISNPFEKALASIVLISYIQPFEDGNKRTARLIGNAILITYNKCPL
ncbi:Fic family protein, partial [Candidatus Gracilibacteria bacterium]|nr:Fic family protein [Candidatus Gracilibacteria bacterium]